MSPGAVCAELAIINFFCRGHHSRKMIYHRNHSFAAQVRHFGAMTFVPMTFALMSLCVEALELCKFAKYKDFLCNLSVIFKNTFLFNKPNALLHIDFCGIIDFNIFSVKM
jgi:hypothetical protein